MALSSASSSSTTQSHLRTRKSFLLLNYLLLASATASAFLVLSLRLIPSLFGLLFLLLQALTVSAAVFACTSHASSSSGKAHGAHMVTTVLAAIFQGATAILAFTRPYEFLVWGLRSYVRVDDGVVILKMAAGLCVVIFCLEWVVLVLAFVLRYYACVDDGWSGPSVVVRGRGGGEGEDLKDWPWPFQV